MNKVCYRHLRHYKYQLMEIYVQNVGMSQYEISTPYLKLTKDGVLEIQQGYAWDGPSGPSIDTLNFMRGSLVHDALYQLIRMEKIAYSHKKAADQLLRTICIEDGMSTFRAWYVYQAVKRFGGSSADPGNEKSDKIICAPGGG